MQSSSLASKTGGSGRDHLGAAGGHGEGNPQGGSGRRGSGAADQILEGPFPARRGIRAGPSGVRAPHAGPFGAVRGPAPHGDATPGTGPRPASPGPPAPGPP